MKHMKTTNANGSNAKPKSATAENAKPNAERIWKQIEDDLVPRLRLPAADRVVYTHLVRHSRLEGKVGLRFSIDGLARRVGLSCGPVRFAVRRLASHGVVRLVRRDNAGHFVEVRLPEEVRASTNAESTGFGTNLSGNRLAYRTKLDRIDFFRRRGLHRGIHIREGGFCFYCMGRLDRAARCLDHVVPLARYGRNSYRNLVSCCSDCNSQKSQRPASEFLRWLHREQRLTASELKNRLAALKALAAGRLVPPLPPRILKAVGRVRGRD